MTDKTLEVMIGHLLRGGVLLAATIVAMAGMFYLTEHYSDPVNFGTFQPEPSSLRSVPGIVQSALRGRSDAMIQLGLVLLIATPVARVALATLGFYLEGDRFYVAVSATVLAILVFSITHAV